MYYVVDVGKKKVVICEFSSERIVKSYMKENYQTARIATASDPYVQFALDEVRNERQSWPVIMYIEG